MSAVTPWRSKAPVCTGQTRTGKALQDLCRRPGDLNPKYEVEKLRKISAMYQWSGGADPKHTCGECSNCTSIQRGKQPIRKCVIYGNTEDVHTDWNESYMACRAFGMTPPKTPLLLQNNPFLETAKIQEASQKQEEKAKTRSVRKTSKEPDGKNKASGAEQGRKKQASATEQGRKKQEPAGKQDRKKQELAGKQSKKSELAGKRSRVVRKREHPVAAPKAGKPEKKIVQMSIFDFLGSE